MLVDLMGYVSTFGACYIENLTTLGVGSDFMIHYGNS